MPRLYMVLLTLAMATGQQAPTSLPSWLIPYPSAKAETQTALATRIEVTYTTESKPDRIIAHYQHLFEGASLPFLPSFDGMGTSIRAAAADCDLLIKIQAQEEGSQIRISCGVKTSPTTSSPTAMEVVTTTSPANNRARTMEERKRQGEEHTRQVLADAQAKHKQGIQKMAIYDQPVNARSRKKDAPPHPEN
jgi:hypothetical protein